MSEENLPALTRSDEQLVPVKARLPYGKSNLLLDLQKLQKNPIFRISVDILQNTNFLRAFSTSANVPSIYIQQFWNTLTQEAKTGITPVDPTNPFILPPAGEIVMDFMNELGYPKGVVTRTNVDYAEVLWEEFVQGIHTFFTHRDKQNIPEKEDTTLSLLSKEASLVVEGPLDASKDTILSSALNDVPLEVVFAVHDDEESTSGKTIVDEYVGIEQNEHVYFNMGKSLNLVVAANDVGNNGFSAIDHQWQGDFFATGGAAQVDTWNHNSSQPVNTFEWGSGSVRCNLEESNIVATYGNDMGITNYGPRLKTRL
ncbi:hypothetical protein Tco_0494803 [Tanacetum coccineum]